MHRRRYFDTIWRLLHSTTRRNDANYIRYETTHNQDALSDLSLGLVLMGTHNRDALSDLSLGLGLMGTHNRNALSDLSLGLVLVGATIETLQTYLDVLDIETRFTHNREALSDLSLGLGLVGATVETLGTNLDALDIETRFTHTTNSLGDLSLGLGLVGATVETLHTNLDALEIETRFTQHTEALGDLGLGLGLVGVVVETLGTNLDALDTSIDTQFKTLNKAVTGNRTAIITLGEDTETRFGLVGATVETLEERVTTISPHPYARYMSLIGRPQDGFSARSVNIFLLNVAVFTPFNERGATILEFPDHNIALDKPVTTNVTSNSAFRITGMSPIGAHITGTDDVSDVRVLIDLGSEFLIEEIMITGILPDPEGGYPTGYNKILAVELLDTKTRCHMAVGRLRQRRLWLHSGLVWCMDICILDTHTGCKKCNTV